MTLIKHLNVELTKLCNQNCFYCFNNSGRSANPEFLPKNDWLNIFKSLKRYGLNSVHFTGGEPFMYPKIIELIRDTQKMGLQTSILSNGYKIMEYCAKYPDVFKFLTVAQISLDSLDPAKHNNRRNYSKAYEDAISAIDALRKLEVSVEVSCVLNDENNTDVPQMIEFCKKNDAKLILRPVLKTGRALDNDLKNETKNFGKTAFSCQYSNLLTNDRFSYVVKVTDVSGLLESIGILTLSPIGKPWSEILFNNSKCHTIEQIIHLLDAA